jgi:hypothetical protein
MLDAKIKPKVITYYSSGSYFHSVVGNIKIYNLFTTCLYEGEHRINEIGQKVLDGESILEDGEFYDKQRGDIKRELETFTTPSSIRSQAYTHIKTMDEIQKKSYTDQAQQIISNWEPRKKSAWVTRVNKILNSNNQDKLNRQYRYAKSIRDYSKAIISRVKNVVSSKKRDPTELNNKLIELVIQELVIQNIRDNIQDIKIMDWCVKFSQGMNKTYLTSEYSTNPKTGMDIHTYTYTPQFKQYERQSKNVYSDYKDMLQLKEKNEKFMKELKEKKEKRMKELKEYNEKHIKEGKVTSSHPSSRGSSLGLLGYLTVGGSRRKMGTQKKRKRSHYRKNNSITKHHARKAKD